MNRQEWFAFYRDLRADRRADDGKPRNKGMGRAIRMFHVAGRPFTIACGFGADSIRNAYGRPFRLVPSMISDRSPQSRVADALEWARYYRQNAARCSYGRLRARYIADALACVADARAIPCLALARLP